MLFYHDSRKQSSRYLGSWKRIRPAHRLAEASTALGSHRRDRVHPKESSSPIDPPASGHKACSSSASCDKAGGPCESASAKGNGPPACGPHCGLTLNPPRGMARSPRCPRSSAPWRPPPSWESTTIVAPPLRGPHSPQTWAAPHPRSPRKCWGCPREPMPQ